MCKTGIDPRVYFLPVHVPHSVRSDHQRTADRFSGNYPFSPYTTISFKIERFCAYVILLLGRSRTAATNKTGQLGQHLAQHKNYLNLTAVPTPLHFRLNTTDNGVLEWTSSSCLCATEMKRLDLALKFVVWAVQRAGFQRPIRALA